VEVGDPEGSALVGGRRSRGVIGSRCPAARSRIREKVSNPVEAILFPWPLEGLLMWATSANPDDVRRVNCSQSSAGGHWSGTPPDVHSPCRFRYKYKVRS